MKTNVVNLKGFAEKLKAHNKEHMEKLQSALLLGLAKAMPMMAERSPVDTGLYAQSWKFEKREWGAVFGNIAPHAAIIEYGARPFTPPIAPLLAWAKRVLTGVKVQNADGSSSPIATGQPETNYTPEVWALAKYTQKKIAAVGMAPRHIMENAIPEILELVKQEYLNADNKD